MTFLLIIIICLLCVLCFKRPARARTPDHYNSLDWRYIEAARARYARAARIEAAPARRWPRRGAGWLIFLSGAACFLFYFS